MSFKLRTERVKQTRNSNLYKIAKQLARDLRKTQTEAEKIFWEAVRNRKFLGIKFYRQYPIFFEYFGQDRFFVADFYCHEKLIVIEIDGKIHDYQKDYDELKDFIINTLGIKVIRFRNEEIINDLTGMLKKLSNEVGKN